MADISPLIKSSIPEALFRQYLTAAMELAHAEPEDDSNWFAEIPAFAGLWGEGSDAASALADLRSALEEWSLLKIRDEDRDLPVVAGINLNGR